MPPVAPSSSTHPFPKTGPRAALWASECLAWVTERRMGPSGVGGAGFPGPGVHLGPVMLPGLPYGFAHLLPMGQRGPRGSSAGCGQQAGSQQHQDCRAMTGSWARSEHGLHLPLAGGSLPPWER